MNICMFGAASDNIAAKYIDAAFSLGCELASRGHHLVFGGGATGTMGAAARSVHQHGGTLTGVAPHFFRTEGVLYPHCTEMIYTDNMSERKVIMEQSSDGFVILPGGLGTMDELFEILTLNQLNRINKPVAVINVDGFFDPLRELLDRFYFEEFMALPPSDFCGIYPTCDEALDFLESFYANRDS